MGSGYSNRECDCGGDYEDTDCDCLEEDRQRRKSLQQERVSRIREAKTAIQERERRRERYEDAGQDEYAVVPVKAYDETVRQAVVSPQELQDRQMGMLKVEEQKIKNKIANERLAFDMQKRQQSRELHEIKVALLSKYPNILFNKQGISDFKAE